MALGSHAHCHHMHHRHSPHRHATPTSPLTPAARATSCWRTCATLCRTTSRSPSASRCAPCSTWATRCGGGPGWRLEPLSWVRPRAGNRAGVQQPRFGAPARAARRPRVRPTHPPHTPGRPPPPAGPLWCAQRRQLWRGAVAEAHLHLGRRARRAAARLAAPHALLPHAPADHQPARRRAVLRRAADGERGVVQRLGSGSVLPLPSSTLQHTNKRSSSLSSGAAASSSAACLLQLLHPNLAPPPPPVPPCLPSPAQAGAPLRPVTVRDAIGDLPAIESGHAAEEMEYVSPPVSRSTTGAPGRAGAPFLGVGQTPASPLTHMAVPGQHPVLLFWGAAAHGARPGHTAGCRLHARDRPPSAHHHRCPLVSRHRCRHSSTTCGAIAPP